MMKKVQRHSLMVRFSHWAIALSGIMLLFSGFGQMPMYKRYNIVKIPGMAWSSNYEITLTLHYLAAVIFTAAALFHLLYHIRRDEFGLLPRKGDLKASALGLLSMIGLGTEPRHEKFQAKQRIIYLVFACDSAVLIVTGLVKSYKNLGAIIVDPMLLQWMAFSHTIASMIFMILVLAHIAALGIVYRPMIPSMFTGRMDAAYARRHHSDWNIDHQTNSTP